MYLFILTIRSFTGVGLTDEIQYYYQIIGLLDNDRLFTNDLYIQQLIYLVFYPIFKPYYLLFGEVGLVLYGRAVFSTLLFLVYEFSRRQFVCAGCRKFDAGFAAVALVIVIPYHGIFAVSYNTISQMCWVLTIILVVFRLPISVWIWSFIIVVSALSHPVGGIAIAAVCASYCLVFGQVKKLLNILLLATIIGIMTSSVIIMMSGGFDAFVQALNFTRGFSVGSAIAKPTQITRVLIIALLLVLAMTVPAPRKFKNVAIIGNILLLLVFEYYVLQLSLNSTEKHSWASSYSTTILGFWVTICSLGLYALRCFKHDRTASRANFYILLLLISFQAIVLAGTSSNGVVQSVGAFAISVPIIAIFIAINSQQSRTRLLPRLLVILVTIVSASISVGLPYGQSPLYSSDRYLSNIPILGGLYLTNGQLDFFANVRDNIGPLVSSKEGLILGKVPAFYPILGVKPNTCMIYNHSLGSIGSRANLSKCLLNRNIHFILNISEWGQPDDEINALMKDIALKNNLECFSHKIVLASAQYGLPQESELKTCVEKTRANKTIGM